MKKRSRERGVSIIYKKGQKLGNFIFIRETECRILQSGKKSRRADFECRCGKIFNACIAEIKHRGQKTCGCIWSNYVVHNKKHNGVGTREYNIWRGMRKRCNNKNCPDYKDYGGRGIKISDEWNEFKNFIADMGSAPSNSHSIDRKNPDLGYNKDNCRWATHIEQANNRRTTVYLTLNGKTLTIGEWTKITGLSRTTIERRRVRKWNDEKILTTPKLINQFV